MPEDSASNHSQTKQGLRLDIMLLAVVLLFVVGMFWQTVFAGKSISRVHMVAEWDSIFSSFKTGMTMGMDPSQVLVMVPFYLLVGRIWHGGDLPLWNPYNGLGVPLAAEPQAQAFNPLHLPLAVSSTMHVYNLLLVSELAIMALGGYLLGRSFGLTKVPALFLALTLFACPYQQWYLELLGNGYCLIPLLLFSFARAARVESVGSAVFAGSVAGTMVLAAHPELAFCSISLATLLHFLTRPASEKNKTRPLMASIPGSLLSIAIAALVAVCLSAPMLFPFVESLANSETYKFDNRAPAYIPWQTIAFGLILPGFGGASPYLGVLSTLVFPLSFFTIFGARRHGRTWSRQCLLATALLAALSLALSSKMYPIAMILAQKPFCYVIMTYFFPSLLVLVAVMAAFGLERLLLFIECLCAELAQGSENRLLKPEWLVLVAMAVLIFTFPFLVELFHINPQLTHFDMTLPAIELKDKTFTLRGILAICLLVVSFVLSFTGKNKRIAAVLAVVLVGLGVASELAVTRKSLPITPSFDFPETETIAKLKTLEGRLIATGEHTLKPNVASVYGLQDIRYNNCLAPRGYLPFMQAAGASINGFNQCFSNELNSLINLASVSHVVTLDALFDRSFFNRQAVDVVAPSGGCRWNTNLSLMKFPIAWDEESHAVYLEPRWHGTANGKYSYIVSLKNDRDVLWLSDAIPIRLASDGWQAQPIAHGAPLPLSLKAGDKLCFQISVVDGSTGQFVKPLSTSSILEADGSIKTSAHGLSATAPGNERQKRFRLVTETKDRMRIYENLEAVPQAFLVEEAHIASNDKDALAQIVDPAFDARHIVVTQETGEQGFDAEQKVEGLGEGVPVAGSEGLPAKMLTTPATTNEAPLHLWQDLPRPGKVKIVERRCNRVLLETESEHPSTLVLTDMWYPGWCATIDGIETKILKANYAFKAVSLPEGKHKVEFRFTPKTFVLAQLVFSIVCVVILGMVLSWIVRRRKTI